MKTLCSALLILSTLVGACHAPIGLDKLENTYSAVEGGFELQVDKNDVQLNEVDVENARSSRAAGLLRVDLDLANTANYRVPLEWRMHWYTSGGTEVNFQNPWRPTVLDVHETRAMTMTAPLPACTGWKLSTRSPHTSN
jgi:uncharacterized protein YcfL